MLNSLNTQESIEILYEELNEVANKKNSNLYILALGEKFKEGFLNQVGQEKAIQYVAGLVQLAEQTSFQEFEKFIKDGEFPAIKIDPKLTLLLKQEPKELLEEVMKTVLAA